MAVGLQGATSEGEDDFAFDVGEDLVVELTEPPAAQPHGGPRPVAKLKGMPDITAEVGKMLEFTIPRDAFQGEIVKYEVSMFSFHYYNTL